MLKLFLKIIHQRLYTKIEEFLSDSQSGFRRGFGTREALFSVQVLIQRARDVDVDTYACFIDYEKAFDKVKHGKLMTILEKIGIDAAERRFIKSLYWHQIFKKEYDKAIFYLRYFNIYPEDIFNKALERVDCGISINGVVVNNLRFADDKVLLLSDAEGLQTLINRVTCVSEEYGLSLNIKKKQR